MPRVKYLKADEETGKKAGDFGHIYSWDATQAAVAAGLVEDVSEVKEEDLDKLNPADAGEIRGSTRQAVYDLTGSGEVLGPDPGRTTQIGGTADARAAGAQGVKSSGQPADEYDVMTRAELDKEAQKKGVNVSSARTRDDVIKALRSA